MLRKGLMVGALLLATGCAVGGPGELDCTIDVDCPVGMQCDSQQGICVGAKIDTNVGTDATRVVPNSSPGSQPGNVDVLGDGQDDEPANNATAVNNSSSSNNGSQNTNGGTTSTTTGATPMPDCAATGQDCDPARPAQGGFACLGVEGGGVCLKPCDHPYAASTCAAGDYCWDIDGQNLCVPSTCSSNADCTSGTCIDFDNSFSVCYQGGTLSAGDACDPADDQCPADHACDPLTDTCEPMCDPWASTCPAGHACAVPLTPRTGVCTHALDTTAPNDAFNECLDPGAACDDAVACFALSSTIAGCLKYCRPGSNDCAGIVTATGTSTICDAHALYESDLGLCWPACDPAAPDPCGTGAVCVNQMCRIPCTPGNEVADCCGGSSSCTAVCNATDNLCE